MKTIPREPAELRRLTTQKLPAVCQAMRFEIINTISRVGGHLASSLGVIELTVALHYCFQTPEDRLVWDIGHQAYGHKILTSRLEQLGKIRQLGGISGYLKRSESPYDHFGAGHAGTSISAAVGMRLALDSENYVVAILGDGALSAGMAYEALNHAGGLNLERLIVVLNDNGQSIAENVGGLSRFSRNDQEGKLSGFFNALGFSYRGPVDGHDIEALIAALRSARNSAGPLLLHVRTIKGKGLPCAESDPEQFHAVRTPIIENVSSTTNPTYRAASYSDVFGDLLLEMARNDQKIHAITAGMPGGTGLKKFAEELPEQFHDVGIAEQHAVTLAAGLACEGVRPVCALYSSFLQRAYDQIIHDVCIQNLPVVFAIDRAGLVGNDGETHQGTFDIAYLRCIPNLLLMSPTNVAEFRAMLRYAIQSDGPTALRYPRSPAPDTENSIDLLSIQEQRMQLLKHGCDGIIIALGDDVKTALAISQTIFMESGREIAVINGRFANRFDRELLERMIPGQPFVAIIEEHSRAGGYSSAFLEFINDQGISLSGSIFRFGVQDSFTPQASREQQKALNKFDLLSVLNCLRKASKFSSGNRAIA